MGNSVRRLFGFGAVRPGRAKAMKFLGPSVDDAEVDLGEANDPVAAVGLGDADGFALQLNSGPALSQEPDRSRPAGHDATGPERDYRLCAP